MSIDLIGDMQRMMETAKAAIDRMEWDRAIMLLQLCKGIALKIQQAEGNK
jgi:hypothetical protein